VAVPAPQQPQLVEYPQDVVDDVFRSPYGPKSTSRMAPSSRNYSAGPVNAQDVLRLFSTAYLNPPDSDTVYQLEVPIARKYLPCAKAVQILWDQVAPTLGITARAAAENAGAPGTITSAGRTLSGQARNNVETTQVRYYTNIALASRVAQDTVIAGAGFTALTPQAQQQVSDVTSAITQFVVNHLPVEGATPEEYPPALELTPEDQELWDATLAAMQINEDTFLSQLGAASNSIGQELGLSRPDVRVGPEGEFYPSPPVQLTEALNQEAERELGEGNEDRAEQLNNLAAQLDAERDALRQLSLAPNGGVLIVSPTSLLRNDATITGTAQALGKLSDVTTFIIAGTEPVANNIAEAAAAVDGTPPGTSVPSTEPGAQQLAVSVSAEQAAATGQENIIIQQAMTNLTGTAQPGTPLPAPTGEPSAAVEAAQNPNLTPREVSDITHQLAEQQGIDIGASEEAASAQSPLSGPTRTPTGELIVPLVSPPGTPTPPGAPTAIDLLTTYIVDRGQAPDTTQSGVPVTVITPNTPDAIHGTLSGAALLSVSGGLTPSVQDAVAQEQRDIQAAEELLDSVRRAQTSQGATPETQLAANNTIDRALGTAAGIVKAAAQLPPGSPVAASVVAQTMRGVRAAESAAQGAAQAAAQGGVGGGAGGRAGGGGGRGRGGGGRGRGGRGGAAAGRAGSPAFVASTFFNGHEAQVKEGISGAIEQYAQTSGSASLARVVDRYINQLTDAAYAGASGTLATLAQSSE